MFTLPRPHYPRHRADEIFSANIATVAYRQPHFNLYQLGRDEFHVPHEALVEIGAKKVLFGKLVDLQGRSLE